MAPKPNTNARPAGAKLLNTLYRPVDAASMVVIRIVFGLLMMALVAKLLITGGIERYYLAQDIRFKYPLFALLPEFTIMVSRPAFLPSQE